MATESDTSENVTFDEVDWDEIEGNRALSSSPRFVGQVIVYAVLTLGVIYDRFVLRNQAPTINTSFLVWDLTAVDWMFVGTILVLVFNLAVPAYQNSRLTMYYWRQFKKNKMALVGVVYLIAMALLGVIGPILMEAPTQDWGAFNYVAKPPVYMTAQISGQTVTGTWAHPFGTTPMGTDLFKLIVYGMRISLEIGLISTLIAITVGTVVGATAAHMGGLVDEVLMRYVDIQATFPVFILLLFLASIFNLSLFMLIMLFGFFGWENIARLVRSEALQRTEEDYIKAAESSGASEAWIIRRHVIPNVSSTVLTAASLMVPVFILGEAALSFLGLGPAGVHSWGQTIQDGYKWINTAWWVATVPGIVLFVTVLAISYVGDAINDAIDPRREAEE